jgi:hypothetical protein
VTGCVTPAGAIGLFSGGIEVALDGGVSDVPQGSILRLVTRMGTCAVYEATRADTGERVVVQIVEPTETVSETSTAADPPLPREKPPAFLVSGAAQYERWDERWAPPPEPPPASEDKPRSWLARLFGSRDRTQTPTPH